MMTHINQYYPKPNHFRPFLRKKNIYLIEGDNNNNIQTTHNNDNVDDNEQETFEASNLVRYRSHANFIHKNI